MNTMKRVLCLLMALILCAGLVPAMATRADAATTTTPTTMTRSMVMDRINILIGKLGGQHFTKNHSFCGYGQGQHKSCTNCLMTTVVQRQWFKDELGTDYRVPSDISYYPEHYGYNSGWSCGYTCCGFATWAGWWIFSNRSTDKVTFNRIEELDANGDGKGDGAGTFEAETMSKAVPGDIVRLGKTKTGSHSVIFIETGKHKEKDGIFVLDCNWDYDLNNNFVGNSVIQYHFIPYDCGYKYVGISRATNYDTSDNDCATCGRQCEEPVDHISGTLYPNGSLLGVYSAPYSKTIHTVTGSEAALTSYTKETLLCRINDSSYKVTGRVKNCSGSEYYKIIYNGCTAYVPYFPEENPNSSLKPHFSEDPAALTISPVFRYQTSSGASFDLTNGIGEGVSVWLQGKLTATNDTIKTVHVGIYKPDGTLAITGSGYTNNAVNKTSFNLADADSSSALPFSKLAPGDYIFKITAQGSASKSEKRYSFTVGTGSLAISPAFRNAPGNTGEFLCLNKGIMKGSSVWLTGTLDAANDIIKTVHVGIYKQDGTTLAIPESGYTKTVNNTSFNLADADNSTTLPFSKLGAGDYIFKVTATRAGSSVKERYEVKFTVGTASNVLGDKNETVATVNTFANANVVEPDPEASAELTVNAVFHDGAADGPELILTDHIALGTDVYLTGTLAVNAGTIEWVTVGIYHEDGETPVKATVPVIGTQRTCVYKNTAVNSASFDLAKVDNAPLRPLLFNCLPKGSYVFKIEAKVSGTDEALTTSYPFKVKAWSDWSEWSTTKIEAGDGIEIEERIVPVVGKQTEYRYCKYLSTEAGISPTGAAFNAGKSYFHEAFYNNAGYKQVYTEWSTTQVAGTSVKSFRWETNNAAGTGTEDAATGMFYWKKYVVNGANYYWEETRTVDVPTEQVQYRYRTFS